MHDDTATMTGQPSRALSLLSTLPGEQTLQSRNPLRICTPPLHCSETPPAAGEYPARVRAREAAPPHDPTVAYSGGHTFEVPCPACQPTRIPSENLGEEMHHVLATFERHRGRDVAPWSTLDAKARERVSRIAGVLLGCEDAGAAYETVRQHERVEEEPATPWGALDARDRLPWVIAAAFVATWRRGQ